MEHEKGDKKILVLYHAECSDGFGAAYAAWKKFGDEADYVPTLYKTEPPDVKGKTVYILDYGYPKDATSKLSNEAERLVMIDHHITNEETVKMASEHVFELENSGSILAWKYFHPEKEVPLFLKYIEDKDLWKFSLPDSKAVSRWFANLPPDFEIWDKTIKEFEDEEKRNEFIAEGKIILDQVNRVVADIVENAKQVEFEGYKTLIANAQAFHSEVGNALAIKLPPIGIIWTERGGRISVSLRSDGTVNVAELAERYGGGGHKSASGFVLDSKDDLLRLFPEIKD